MGTTRAAAIPVPRALPAGIGPVGLQIDQVLAIPVRVPVFGADGTGLKSLFVFGG